LYYNNFAWNHGSGLLVLRHFAGDNTSVAMQDLFLILRFTRHWIHYGFLAHVTVCTLVAAVEGLLGR